MNDDHYMGQALRLAARALGRTRPNPVVGCVIVRDDRVVGKGYHHQAGRPHAEVEALRLAGASAKGATAYVTLEPCSHFGRTPPCTDALARAGIARVVAAMVDPNPRVAGRGVEDLKEHGMEVKVGVRETDARSLNLPFITWITRGRPMVTLKAASSLDGKMATRGGESQWITGEMARLRGQRLRDMHDVVMVGIGTILSDNPRLTCRLPGGRDPIRLVVDTHLRIPDDAAVFTSSESAPLWIATTGLAPADRREELAERPGVRVLVCRQDDFGRVDLGDLLMQLGRLDVTSVLSESGGTLSHALLAARLADRLALFLAPKLVGGRDAPGFLDGVGLGVERLEHAPMVVNPRLCMAGDDLVFSGEIHYPELGQSPEGMPCLRV